MKHVVTALPFTGGPLVCNLLSALLNEPVTGYLFQHTQGQRVSALEAVRIGSTPGIVHTQSIPAVDLLGYPQFTTYTTVREFPSLICSRILAERYDNPTELFVSDPKIRSILSTLGNVDNAAFLNLVISTNPDFVLDEARKWRRACCVVLDKNVVQVMYKNLVQFPELVVKRIGNKLGVRQELQDKALKNLEDSLDYTSYEKLLDGSSKAVLQKVIQQVNKERIL